MSSKGIEATVKLAAALGVGAPGDAKAADNENRSVEEEIKAVEDVEASVEIEKGTDEVRDGPLASLVTSEDEGEATSVNVSVDSVDDGATDGS